MNLCIWYKASCLPKINKGRQNNDLLSNKGGIMVPSVAVDHSVHAWFSELIMVW